MHIAVDQLRAVVKDGKVLHLSSEEQELKDFLLNQVRLLTVDFNYVLITTHRVTIYIF